MAEFNNKLEIVDCESHNCDMYKFNGQAICFKDGCPYEVEEID